MSSLLWYLSILQQLPIRWVCYERKYVPVGDFEARKRQNNLAGNSQNKRTARQNTCEACMPADTWSCPILFLPCNYQCRIMKHLDATITRISVRVFFFSLSRPFHKDLIGVGCCFQLSVAVRHTIWHSWSECPERAPVSSLVLTRTSGRCESLSISSCGSGCKQC